MSSQVPSIQSFYQRETPSGAPRTSSAHAGDGFSSSEVEAVLNPLTRPWKPSREYEKSPILFLQTGNLCYEITGRVVYFSTSGARHPAHGGCDTHHTLVMSDGTAAISVRLFFSKASDYQMILGQRVTAWASHISASTRSESGGSIPHLTCSTTIYPGRKQANHIIFHDDPPSSDLSKSCRLPLGWEPESDESLPGLLTLKAFLSSGHDMEDGKILVCVRSIGPRKTVRPKKRQALVDLVEVGVFDDTAQSVLQVWGDKVPSAKTWQPNQTILLISRPTCRAPDRYHENAVVEIGWNSIVEVDSVFPDSDWLLKKAKDMMKKERVILPFPQGVWSDDLSRHGTLFTLADLDEEVRRRPDQEFTGKINVIVLEMNLAENWFKGTGCCFDCCGVPLYSNKAVAECKNCLSQQSLSMNPRVVGTLIDESGELVAGKLVWSDEAWTQLFFGSSQDEAKLEDTSCDETGEDLIDQSWEDITAFDSNTIKDMEDSLLHSRLTLTFGWYPPLERLCVLGVEW